MEKIIMRRASGLQGRHDDSGLRRGEKDSRFCFRRGCRRMGRGAAAVLTLAMLGSMLFGGIPVFAAVPEADTPAEYAPVVDADAHLMAVPDTNSSDMASLAADLPVMDADVTEPSEGCYFAGLTGTYFQED